MSVLNYFKNTPGRPSIGRQALSVIFFLQICNEVPGKKRGGLSPPQRATGSCRPLGGDRVPSPKVAVCRHSLCRLSLKIQEKSQLLPPFPLSFEPKNS